MPKPTARPKVTYAVRADASEEEQLNSLAAMCEFVLRCHAKNEAARHSSPVDARKSQDARTRSHST